jgi:pantothenate kinase-related protein Tda10
MIEYHFEVEIQFIQQVLINNNKKNFIRSSSIFHKGRPAWYNATGEIKEAFVIGICGGSASGKTTVAQSIVEKLNVPWVTLLSMDSFYKVRGR